MKQPELSSFGMDSRIIEGSLVPISLTKLHLIQCHFWQSSMTNTSLPRILFSFLSILWYKSFACILPVRKRKSSHFDKLHNGYQHNIQSEKPMSTNTIVKNHVYEINVLFHEGLLSGNSFKTIPSQATIHEFYMS